MYQYFKELEKPDDYKIYLENNSWQFNTRKEIDKNLSFEFVEGNRDLFGKLKELDKIILGHNKVFGYPLFMEGNRRWTLTELYYYPEDLQQNREECGLKEISIITNTEELIRKLDEYQVYCNYFMDLYPNKKNYFRDIKSSIQSALEKIVTYIQLPPKNRIVDYVVPNVFFITRSGFLYNPNGEVGNDVKGHKEGNLRYSFDRIERNISSNKKIKIPYYGGNVTYKEYLKEIIKNGCVSEMDFHIYSNMTLDFNVVLTEKMLAQKKFLDFVTDLPDRELKFLIMRDKKIGIEINNQEREQLMKRTKSLLEIKTSYQPNINALIQGYFAAVIDVYESFRRLNVSNHKKEILEKIYGFSWDVWDKYMNTLIRFNGFHKVESCERKITTSTLYGVELFKAYLEKGWDLYIVPPIVYDAYLDNVAELDFQSYYVREHFDKVLKEYNGKGRVLVRDINC